jgi:hypothetical protein
MIFDPITAIARPREGGSLRGIAGHHHDPLEDDS